MFHVFFLKIATNQSTPKILYILKGTKERTKAPLPCQFCPTASSKLTPPVG
jgi:hypothetical protein